MRIKSYFANTVEAALPLAAKEMGDEAMLLYSRESAPETRYLGRYEVVFGVGSVAPAGPASPASGPQPPSQVAWGEVLARLEELERKIEGRSPGRGTDSGRDGRRPEAPAFDPATLAIDQGPAEEAVTPRPSWKAEITLRLLAQQLERNWIERLLDYAGRVANSTPTNARETAWSALRTHMAKGGPASAAAGFPRVVAITGPAGAGKTTCVIKLAAAYWKRSGRWPGMVALPCPATAQSTPETRLEAYAQLTGTACESVNTPAQLGLRLRAAEPGSLTLIDAGVLSPTYQGSPGFAGILRATDGAEIWLVLSASHMADLDMTADAYGWLAPSRLIYTHLDGVRRWGPLWALSASRSIPVSHFSTGPRIFDDFAEARTLDLVDRILGPPSLAEQAATVALSARQTPVTQTAPPALAGQAR